MSPARNVVIILTYYVTLIFWEFSGAKQVCEPIEGYETCCPECDHEFKTDFVH